MLFCLQLKILKAYMPVNENVMTACFCASGWLHVYISWKHFLARSRWYLVQWTLKMNSKLNVILWLMKLQIKWAIKLRYHVSFATQHTGLHNQILQDGISSLENKCQRWNVQMRMEQRKFMSPLQQQRSFWNSKCYVMSEDISNS